MDDYQKHLERQLQQQQQQLRNQANELGTTRTLGPAFLQQPQQQQQQQQQRIQQPPLQWSMNNIPGNTLQTGNPGFGRGGPVLGNPTNSLAGHQHQIQQPGQPIPPSYSASPQQHVPNLQSTVQVPVMKNQGSPAPGSPHQGSDDPAEKMRIVTLLEINSRLIKICESLRSTVPPQNLQTDPTHTGCLLRLQQNLAYLAAIADRANKAESAKQQLPPLSLLTSPPMIRILEEKDALDKLYSALSSLQAHVDTTNGDNASGSESGSQVNSPQVRSRQTSAGSSGIPGPQGQRVPTPTMQRSQLPGHSQQHTPSPHLIPSQLHGQSGLNPNANQGNIRPQQPQQQQFAQNFPQTQQFQSQTSAPQYQQLAQHAQFAQQTQNSQFSPQNTNQQFPQQLNQNQMFPQQNQTQQQFSQFQQQQQQQQQAQTQPLQQQQTPQSFQPQPHLQPRAPSRPPSRPGSQHSLSTPSHQPSPTISPRPGHQPQPGPSPQLTSAPNPSNPSSRMGMPNLPVDLTPEQTAVLQERMRLAREARMQQIQQAQQASRPINMFPMQNGVGMANPGLQNGFGSFPHSGGGSMMNGMSSTSAPAQNQNFGAGGTSGND